MARFRVVIENCFGEAVQYWGMLQHRHNLRLGKQQIGKMFPLAMLLFNLHSLLYGNQTCCYFESEALMQMVMVEQFLGLADEI
jgi:hypothetical protein